MVTLDTPARIPPGLQLEQPPSVNNLIAQIDDWVIYHILKTLESDIHYENQLYGPISSFLTSIFPCRRRYMVIPQAIFRRALSDSEVAEDLANVSIGSTGAFHESRDLAGAEHFKQFPDFVAVKVTPQPGIDRDHHIVCVVEVKRNDDTEAQAEEQMEAYMEQAANLPQREESLRGYLVMGNMHAHRPNFPIQEFRNQLAASDKFEIPKPCIVEIPLISSGTAGPHSSS